MRNFVYCIKMYGFALKVMALKRKAEKAEREYKEDLYMYCNGHKYYNLIAYKRFREENAYLYQKLEASKTKLEKAKAKYYQKNLEKVS